MDKVAITVLCFTEIISGQEMHKWSMSRECIILTNVNDFHFFPQSKGHV